jgi:hypothetical protein
MKKSKTLLQRLQSALLGILENEKLSVAQRLEASQLLTDLRKHNPPAKRKQTPKTGGNSGVLGSK